MNTCRWARWRDEAEKSGGKRDELVSLRGMARWSKKERREAGLTKLILDPQVIPIFILRGKVTIALANKTATFLLLLNTRALTSETRVMPTRTRPWRRWMRSWSPKRGGMVPGIPCVDRGNWSSTPRVNMCSLFANNIIYRIFSFWRPFCKDSCLIHSSHAHVVCGRPTLNDVESLCTGLSIHESIAWKLTANVQSSMMPEHWHPGRLTKNI